MKKGISLLVAFATALSVSVTAIAADDTPGSAYNEYATAADGGVNPMYRPSSRLVQNADDTITISENELFLYDEDNKIVVGAYDHLIPDEEYKFRIYVATADVSDTAKDLVTNNIGTPAGTDSNGDPVAAVPGTVKPLSGADLNDGTVRLRTVKGSSYISSARIKTTGRNNTAYYELVINTRAQFGTNMTDAEYTLDVTGNKAGTFVKSSHFFEVGWAEIDDYETDVGEDGVIVISNDAPVITKDQFADISRSANYKTVNFEGDDGGWAFSGRTSGMASSNFYYTYDVIPEIINRLPDQDYKFLSFKGGVTFPTNGEMRIDASDVTSDFSNIYTYLYRNGSLTPISTTYDSDSSEVVFRTNYLGSFVLTDKQITDTSIIGNETDNDDDDDDDDDDDEGDLSGTDNPSTGASGVMDLGMILGLATLVTAGAVSRKRK